MIFTSFNKAIIAAGDAKRVLSISVYKGELDPEFRPIPETEYWVRDDDQDRSDFNKAVGLYFAEILASDHTYSFSLMDSYNEIVARDNAKLDALIGA